MTKSNHWRTKWRFEQMSNNNNDAAIHLVLQIWLRGGDHNGSHDIWAYPVSGGKDHILVTWPTYHLMPFDTGIKNIHLLRVGILTIFKISGHILFKRVRTSPGGYEEQESIWLKIWDLHHLKDIWSFSVEGEGKDQSITGGYDLQIIYCPLTQESRIYMVLGWDIHHVQNIRSFSI